MDLYDFVTTSLQTHRWITLLSATVITMALTSLLIWINRKVQYGPTAAIATLILSCVGALSMWMAVSSVVYTNGASLLCALAIFVFWLGGSLSLSPDTELNDKGMFVHENSLTHRLLRFGFGTDQLKDEHLSLCKVSWMVGLAIIFIPLGFACASIVLTLIGCVVFLFTMENPFKFPVSVIKYHRWPWVKSRKVLGVQSLPFILLLIFSLFFAAWKVPKEAVVLMVYGFGSLALLVGMLLFGLGKKIEAKAEIDPKVKIEQELEQRNKQQEHWKKMDHFWSIVGFPFRIVWIIIKTIYMGVCPTIGVIKEKE